MHIFHFYVFFISHYTMNQVKCNTKAFQTKAKCTIAYKIILARVMIVTAGPTFPLYFPLFFSNYHGV